LQKSIYYINQKSWIARIAAWKLKSRQVAIVIGKTIYLHQTSLSEFLSNERWLLHELKHLEQFRRYGTLKFILLYLFESIRHGYRNNRFEIEARAAELDRAMVSRWQLADIELDEST
jgi:hypothetical protein